MSRRQLKARRQGAIFASFLVLTSLMLPVHFIKLPPVAAHTPTTTRAVLFSQYSVFYPSVALAANGRSVIAFLTGFNELRVAACSDENCTKAKISTLSRRADFFQETSIGITKNGLPIIAFTDLDARTVIARCTNSACSGAQLTTIKDPTFPYERAARIAVGGDGNPLVLSVASPGTSQETPFPQEVLRLRHCKDLSCKTSATTTIGQAPPSDVYAITVNARGFALVVYVRDLALVAADCNDADCTSFTDSVLDTSTSGLETIPSVSAPGSVSVKLGGDGLGLIAYNEDSVDGGVLKILHCLYDPCAAAEPASVHSTSARGTVSLAIDVDQTTGQQKGLIAYDDESTGALTVLHCEDRPCRKVHTGAAIQGAGGADLSLGFTAASEGVLVFAPWSPAYLTSAAPV